MTDYGSVKVSPFGYLYNVYVLPEHRGQGHAHELYALAVQDAEKNNKTIKTNPQEDWMVPSFLEKNGFEQTHEDIGLAEWAHRPAYIRKPKGGK